MESPPAGPAHAGPVVPTLFALGTGLLRGNPLHATPCPLRGRSSSDGISTGGSGSRGTRRAHPLRPGDTPTWKPAATPCRSPLRGRSSRRWILRRRVRLTRDPSCPPSSPWGQGSYVETRCTPPRVGAHSVGEAAARRGCISTGGWTAHAGPVVPALFALGTGLRVRGNPMHATPCRSPLRGRSSLGGGFSAGGSGSRGTRRARPLRPGDRAPTWKPAARHPV
jgi:hypothetical protein